MVTKLSKKISRKYPSLTAFFLNEQPVHELDKQRPALDSNYEKRIPPNVYQSWVNNKFGRTHIKQIREFREINPDMNFFLFEDVDARAYMHDQWGKHPIHSVYSSAKFGPMKTDIFRYCILYDKGGFYFDINKGIQKQLSSFLAEDTSALIANEQNDCIIMPDIDLMDKLEHPNKLFVQWGFGFCSKHPILEKVISNICEYRNYFLNHVFDDPKMAILSHTATGMFTKSIREVLKKSKDLKVLQAGIDFDGYGVYDMDRSWSRYITSSAYAEQKKKPILLQPGEISSSQKGRPL